MRRPTHHGGATSSRFYGVRWKGYRSRIQTTKTPSVVCFFPFTTLDTGTVSLPTNTIKTATSGAAMVCGSPHQFLSKGYDQPCIPSIPKASKFQLERRRWVGASPLLSVFSLGWTPDLLLSVSLNFIDSQTTGPISKFFFINSFVIYSRATSLSQLALFTLEIVNLQM